MEENKNLGTTKVNWKNLNLEDKYWYDAYKNTLLQGGPPPNTQQTLKQVYFNPEELCLYYYDYNLGYVKIKDLVLPGNDDNGQNVP